jgi:hypothetical protein
VEAVICDDIDLAALLLDAGADIDAPGVLAIAVAGERGCGLSLHNKAYGKQL